MKINNDWLQKTDWIKESLTNELIQSGQYEHFKMLCSYLYTFSNSIPVPSAISFDQKEKKFYFSIGNKFCFIPYIENISKYDFVELISRWARRYYPKYILSVKKLRPLTEQETAYQIQLGKFSIEEIFEMKKVVRVKEKGVVELVSIKEDLLHLSINGNRFIYLSKPNPIGQGNINSLSQVLKDFRHCNDMKERKNIITSRMKPIVEVQNPKPVTIFDYSNEMLLNFFRVRVIALHDQPINHLDHLTYKWWKFEIVFPDIEIKKQCFKIVSEYKKNWINKEYKYLKDEFKLSFGIRK